MYLFLFQCLILYNQNIFVLSTPMFGEKVQDTTEGEFPNVVSLMHLELDDPNPAKDHFCSGILVSVRDVLTAGNCIANKKITSTVVVVGSYNLYKGTMYGLLWWVASKDWDQAHRASMRHRNGANDIANIRLRDDVVENIKIPPLSPFTTNAYYGHKVKVASWGEGVGGTTSEIMKKVVLNVLTKSECEKKISLLLPFQFVLNEHTMCTGTKPFALMHHKDSGAPVFFLNYLVGIHETTTPFANDPFDPRKVNIHNSVYYYTNFIETVTQEKFTWPSEE